MITLDFETRSEVNIRKQGASVYARHPSTRVLCLAYAFDDEPIQLWTPDRDANPGDLFARISANETVHAWNVFFERNIWEHVCQRFYGFPPVLSRQWRCTMSEACRMTLPRDLAGAGEALGLPIQKDKVGKSLIQKLCVPRKPRKNENPDVVYWNDGPEDLQNLYAYCVRDVEAERAIHHAIERLPAAELQVWQLDQKINLEGIPVDRPAVVQAIRVAGQSLSESIRDLSKVTGGTVTSPRQVQALREWLSARGVELPDLSADTVSTALLRDDLPTNAQAALGIRYEAAKGSTGKLSAMLDRMDSDNRVRGGLVYHGAATGRWAGSGVQIQNFPRPALKEFEIEAVFNRLPTESPRQLDLLLSPPLHCLASALRGFIKPPPGYHLIVGDFAQIEARVLAWLAGQDDLTAEFRDGADVYKSMAGVIYDKSPADVSKDERQMGKTAVLGCGYGLGHKAFVAACRAMAGVDITRKFAKRVIDAYRTKNDRIKSFWSAINSACIRAIQTSKPHQCGPIRILPSVDWLRLVLPSGRALHYRCPKLVEVVAPWTNGFRGSITGPETLEDAIEAVDVDLGERQGGTWTDCFVPKSRLNALRSLPVRTDLEACEPQMINQIEYLGVKSPSNKWGRKRTYGGKLVENLTQAVARDFLAAAMIRLDRAGYRIIATVHDEIISEARTDFGSVEHFEAIMAELPSWGGGCPVSVEAYAAERYRK